MKSLGSLRAEHRGGCRSARDSRFRRLFHQLPVQILPIGFWLLAFSLQPSALAQDSICARVKIEILQELTLEREAFEARMTINNGVTGMPIDNISVDVNVADKDRQAASLLREHAGLPNEKILALFEREIITVPFRLEAHAGPVTHLLEKYRDQGMQLADACLVRMSELKRDSRVFTLDQQEFRVYRRFDRQVIPLVAPERVCRPARRQGI